MFEIIVTARQNCLPVNGNLMLRCRHMVIMYTFPFQHLQKGSIETKKKKRKYCLFPSLCKCIRLWSFPSVPSKETSAFSSTAIFIRHVDKHKHENECTPRCINISLRIFYDTSQPNESLEMLFKGNKHTFHFERIKKKENRNAAHNFGMKI